MCTHITMFSYPESDWGTDVVRFIFDDKVRLNDFKSALDNAMLSINKSDFVGLPDYTEAICNEVTKNLGGAWRYIIVSCEIEVNF